MSVKKIKLRKNEVWPLLNMLNEVLYGINTPNDLEKKTRVKKEDYLNLVEKISYEENKDEPVLILTDFESEILQEAYREILNEIEEWEFQTRIGISSIVADEIISKMI